MLSGITNIVCIISESYFIKKLGSREDTSVYIENVIYEQIAKTIRIV